MIQLGFITPQQRRPQEPSILRWYHRARNRNLLQTRICYFTFSPNIIFQNYLVSGSPLQAQHHNNSNIASQVISIQSDNSTTSMIAIIPRILARSQMEIQDWKHVKPLLGTSAAWKKNSIYKKMRNGKLMLSLIYVLPQRLWMPITIGSRMRTHRYGEFSMWPITARPNYLSTLESNIGKTILNRRIRKLIRGYRTDLVWKIMLHTEMILWAINSFQPISTVEDPIFRNMCEAYNNKGLNRGHLCRPTVMAEFKLY